MESSLTDILTSFSKSFYMGIDNLTPYAKHLILTLAIIDTVLSHLKELEEGNHLHILTWNIMKYGFCYYAVDSYSYLLTKILRGFIFVGLKAGGGAITISQFSDPGGIIRLGADLGVPVTNFLRDVAHIGSMANVGQQMSLASTQMGIELSFIVIAIQVFVITLEYYIIGSLAIILLPFGACVHTRFLAEKVWPSIVSCGVKLMVLSFIMSVALPQLFKLKLDMATALAANPALDMNSAQSMQMLGTSLALAFLCWQAPSMASALMSGSSSSSAEGAHTSAKGMNDAGGAARGVGGSMGARISSIMDRTQSAMGGKTKSGATPPGDRTP